VAVCATPLPAAHQFISHSRRGPQATPTAAHDAGARKGSAPMLPMRAVTAHAPPAMWCPRGRLLSHVPVLVVVCLKTAAAVLPLQAQSRPKRQQPRRHHGSPGRCASAERGMAAAAAATADADADAGLRSEFLQVLRSRCHDSKVSLSLSLPPSRSHSCVRLLLGDFAAESESSESSLLCF
jgi:hypothetical protein